jgi:hypothetical protein
MFAITHLTWQQTNERWWLSSAVFPDLAEQRRSTGVMTWCSSQHATDHGGGCPADRDRVTVVRHVVMDSNAMDPLMDLPGAYEALRSAVDAGDLEVLFTHVTIEELAAIPDYERRCRLLIFLVALGRLVPTGVFILGASRLDFGRLSDDTESVRVLSSRSGEAHMRDALIGATAFVDSCALVTHDRRLTARARERGVEVLTSSDLLAEFGFPSYQGSKPIPDRAIADPLDAN